MPSPSIFPPETDGRSAPADARPGFRVLACSPRRGGNTDGAADLLEKTLEESLGERGQTIRVADLPVRPCVSCGWCDAHPGECSLDRSSAPVVPGFAPGPDPALPLLRDLCAAPVACLVSPVYFYHLPARAKALVDRAQAFWSLPSELKPGRGRVMGAVLLGARPRGEKLFAGAILTLRSVADVLGLTLAAPLSLYGLDDAEALSRSPEAAERIREYGRDLAARRFSLPPPER